MKKTVFVHNPAPKKATKKTTKKAPKKKVATMTKKKKSVKRRVVRKASAKSHVKKNPAPARKRRKARAAAAAPATPRRRHRIVRRNPGGIDVVGLLKTGLVAVGVQALGQVAALRYAQGDPGKQVTYQRVGGAAVAAVGAYLINKGGEHSELGHALVAGGACLGVANEATMLLAVKLQTPLTTQTQQPAPQKLAGLAYQPGELNGLAYQPGELSGFDDQLGQLAAYDDDLSGLAVQPGDLGGFYND